MPAVPAAPPPQTRASDQIDTARRPGRASAAIAELEVLAAPVVTAAAGRRCDACVRDLDQADDRNDVSSYGHDRSRECD